MDQKVYDPETEGDRKTGGLKHVSENDQQSGYDRDLADIEKHYGEEVAHPLGKNETGKSDKKSDDATSLKSKEEAPNRSNFSAKDDMREKLGKGYSGKDSNRSWALSKLYSSNSAVKKRIAIAGAAAGGSLLLGVLVFFLMIPLKLEFMIQNLDGYFGASSQQALGKESANMFSEWVARDIMPNLMKAKCKSTISAGCVSVDNGTSPVSKAYNAWRQAKFEQKMAVKYDIVLGRRGNQFYIAMPQATGGILFSHSDAEALMSGKTDLFELAANNARFQKIPVSQAEIREAVRDATSNENFVKNMYNRFRLVRFLKHKYGIRWCIVACNVKDKFADAKRDKLQAAKARIIQRITPEKYGLVAQCIMTECDTTIKHDAVPGDVEERSPFQKQLDTQLVSYAARFGEDSLKQLVQNADDIAKDGLTKVVARKAADAIAGRIGGDAVGAVAGQVAEKAIPIIGWVFFAARIIHISSTIGPVLKAVSYAVNAATSVQLYSVYSAVAAESKSGHMDPTELGSFATALETNVTGSKADRVPASKSHVFQQIMGNTKNPGPAQTDVVLGGGNDFATNVSNMFAGTGLDIVAGPISALGDFFNETIGKLIMVIPGISQAFSWFASQLSNFMNMLTKNIIQSVITTNMSGKDQFDIMAAGADVAHNDSCQATLGCAAISDQTAMLNRQEEIGIQKTQFDQTSMFARMFSTDTPYSLVSKLAVSLPTNNATSFFTSTATDIMSNPFGGLTSTFSSIFSFKNAGADTATNAKDPFKVKQKGYLTGQIPTKPLEYWDANCVTGPVAKYDPTTQVLDVSDWLNKQEEDPETGQAVAKTPNPCLLIYSALISAAGKDDPSLIPPDIDTSADSGAAPTDPGQPGSGTTTGTSLIGDDGFTSGSCVIYVQYILSRHYTGYTRQSFGDGYAFVGNFANAYGITVTHTPTLHAVVSFPRSVADPQYGHVAIVSGINADGSILVEESNWDTPNHYGSHTVPAATVGKLDYASTEGKWH